MIPLFFQFRVLCDHPSEQFWYSMSLEIRVAILAAIMLGCIKWHLRMKQQLKFWWKTVESQNDYSPIHASLDITLELSYSAAWMDTVWELITVVLKRAHIYLASQWSGRFREQCSNCLSWAFKTYLNVPYLTLTLKYYFFFATHPLSL